MKKIFNSYLDKYFCIFKLKKDFMLANKLFKYLNDKELVFIIKILNKLISSDYILIEDKLVIITIKTLILKKVQTHEDWYIFNSKPKNESLKL